MSQDGTVSLIQPVLIQECSSQKYIHELLGFADYMIYRLYGSNWSAQGIIKTYRRASGLS